MGGAGREPGPSAMVVADLGGRSRGFGMGCQERQPQMNTYIGLWNWEHRGKVWFQAVLCQGAQIRPAGPGFSSAFSSSDTVLALFPTVAPSRPRPHPPSPGTPVEHNAYFLIFELTLMA